MKKTSGKEILSEFKYKRLKKMSKDELKSHIADNLIPLVDYYFMDSFRGTSRFTCNASGLLGKILFGD